MPTSARYFTVRFRVDVGIDPYIHAFRFVHVGVGFPFQHFSPGEAYKKLPQLALRHNLNIAETGAACPLHAAGCG